MAPKPFRVQVYALIKEFDFFLEPKATGQSLLNKVTEDLRIHEHWYFGLEYVDAKDFPCWLELDKKILTQIPYKSDEAPLQFNFRARYYPTDISELIEDTTRTLFYNQVKSAILDGQIDCPLETCLLLASYIAQVKRGDCEEKEYQRGILTGVTLLPEHMKNTINLSNPEWEKRVVEWWREHQDLSKEDAMMEYLKIAQDLEMYGVAYYPIRNKKGTPLWLGIDALGINIYSENDKRTPRVGFSWNEIRKVKFDKKKFIIKPENESNVELAFTSDRLRINREMLALCTGYHELLDMLKDVESDEIRRLRTRANSERLQRTQKRENMRSKQRSSRKPDPEHEELSSRVESLESSAKSLRKAVQSLKLQDKQSEARRRRNEAEEIRFKQEQAQRQHEQDMERIRRERQEEEDMVQEIEKIHLLDEEKAKEAQRKQNEAREIEEDFFEIRKRIEQAQENNEGYVMPYSREMSRGNYQSLHSRQDSKSTMQKDVSSDEESDTLRTPTKTSTQDTQQASKTREQAVNYYSAVKDEDDDKSDIHSDSTRKLKPSTLSSLSSSKGGKSNSSLSSKTASIKRKNNDIQEPQTEVDNAIEEERDYENLHSKPSMQNDLSSSKQKKYNSSLSSKSTQGTRKMNDIQEPQKELRNAIEEERDFENLHSKPSLQSNLSLIKGAEPTSSLSSKSTKKKQNDEQSNQQFSTDTYATESEIEQENLYSNLHEFDKNSSANQISSWDDDVRTTMKSKNRTTKEKLEAERKSLQQHQRRAGTREDQIYRENTTDKGIDKYKTLKKIREGTVKRRIDEFEAM